MNSISRTLASPLRRYLSLMLAVTLVACAGVSEKADPQVQVRQRALERWASLVKGEFSKAYNFNTPGFRAVVTQDAYRARFGAAVTWSGAEVVKVDCAEVQKCLVTLRIDFKPTAVGFKPVGSLSTHVDETWLFEADQWWYFQNI